MAEHRRKMQALGRVAETAGRVASSGELRHLTPVANEVWDDALDDAGATATVADDAAEDTAGVVLSLAAARARRSGHPAGTNLRH